MSVFVIAEIGINHNGELAIAKKLIDGAVFAEAVALFLGERMFFTHNSSLAAPAGIDPAIPARQAGVIATSPRGLLYSVCSLESIKTTASPSSFSAKVAAVAASLRFS